MARTKPPISHGAASVSSGIYTWTPQSGLAILNFSRASIPRLKSILSPTENPAFASKTENAKARALKDTAKFCSNQKWVMAQLQHYGLEAPEIGSVAVLRAAVESGEVDEVPRRITSVEEELKTEYYQQYPKVVEGGKSDAYPKRKRDTSPKEDSDSEDEKEVRNQKRIHRGSVDAARGRTRDSRGGQGGSRGGFRGVRDSNSRGRESGSGSFRGDFRGSRDGRDGGRGGLRNSRGGRGRGGQGRGGQGRGGQGRGGRGRGGRSRDS